jgi:hypothetical protein
MMMFGHLRLTWGGSVIPENSKMNIDTIDFIKKHKGGKVPDISIKYPAHEVTLINTSPGGYCLHWVNELPASIQAGEILGIQETGQKGDYVRSLLLLSIEAIA